MKMTYVSALWLLGALSVWSQPGKKLDVVFLNKGALASSRAEFKNNPHHLPPGLAALMKDANAALIAAPLSVVAKKQAPPSGDKHDYLSLAPYWWPDTTKPDGLPYIRRDGERYPEYYTIGDHQSLGRLVDQVRNLALAYSISREEKYARSAAKKLSVWFLEPDTRMNPNLKYAQAVRGVNEGRGTGIIDTRGLMDVIDAIIILRESHEWSKDIDEGMRKWFADYLAWLRESENGKDEAAAKNNHGSIFDGQVACMALFVGNEDLARSVLQDAGPKRIAVQIEPDGSQPLELARTKSWGYCMLNTEALVNLALLGDRAGVDLWHYQTKDGRSLRRAIDFLIPYAAGEKKWTWKQIVSMETARLSDILTIVGERLNDSAYRAAAKRLHGHAGVSSRINFLLPAEQGTRK
jgi:hypothetical protein